MRTAKREIYICEHCGYETETRPMIHGLYEDFYDNCCPRCGDDLELCDSQCAVCHKFITDETSLDNSGLCNDCAATLTSSFEKIIDNLLPEQKDCLLDFIEMRYL